MFYKVIRPGTYRELKAAMEKVADSQAPTTTGKAIADDITAKVVFEATNNQATWDAKKARGHYAGVAAKIDDTETTWRNAAPDFDGASDWQIDCGLLASLAKLFSAGNGDDLASYALDYGMRNHSSCVLAFTQHDGYNHSFVLTYCKGDAAVWLADIWVAHDRSIAFEKSVWCKDSALDCRVMIVKVDKGGAGLIDEWQAHCLGSGKRPKLSAEYPRKAQCGAYTHRSAAASNSGGLI